MLSSRIQASSPVESDQAEAIIAAFDEWAKTVESRARRAEFHPNGYGSSVRQAEESRIHPAVAALERSIYGNDRLPQFRRQPIVRQGPSVVMRIFVAAVYILVAAAIAGAALAWRSSDDRIKDIVAAWETSLTRVSTILGVRSPPIANLLAAAPVSSVPDQVPAENEAVPRAAAETVPQAAVPLAPSATAPVAPSATGPVPAGAPPEVQQQLATIEDDLTAMLQAIEQIASKQEQMAKDIAALQAAQQKISQKISPPNLRTGFLTAPRKNSPKPVRAEAPVELAPAPVPAARPRQPADLP